MSPSLEDALSKFDALGGRLWITAEGRIGFAVPDLPESIRSTFGERREELLTLLRAHQRPVPDTVLFVADNLDTWEVPFGMAVSTTTVHYGNRPYHRLTPKLWFHLNHAVGRLPRNDPNRAAADSILAELSGWIELHYRPDQIERAEHAARTQTGKARPLQAA